MTNDFTLYGGDRKVELHCRDIADWTITFVDTGLHSNIGERLLAVPQVRRERAESSWRTMLTDFPTLPLDKVH